MQGIYERWQKQSEGALHGHCFVFVWLEEFDEIRGVILYPDSERSQAAREKMEQCVDRHFCADYEYSTSLEMVHHECQQCSTINEIFDEVDSKL
jgi:hypothetical protein